MASSDARAVPLKNTAFRLYFDMSKADGTAITTWTFASTGGKISKDGAAFADTTNTIVEVGAGMGYIDLTASEMDAYGVAFYANLTNTGAVLSKSYLYPAIGTGLDIPVKSVSISDSAIAASTFAAGAVNAAALAADAVTEIALGLLDTLLSGHTSTGTVGAALQASGGAGDPWQTLLSSYSGEQAGAILLAVRSLIASAGARVLVPYNERIAQMRMRRKYGLVTAGGAAVPTLTTALSMTGATVSFVILDGQNRAAYTKDVTSAITTSGGTSSIPITISAADASALDIGIFNWICVADYGTSGATIVAEGTIKIE